MNNTPILEINNLHVSVEGIPILSGLNLLIKLGQTHAIMGPNGAGKSTLSKVIAGHPAYSVDKGEIKIDGRDISPLEVEERAHLGLFTGFQYPMEIGGVSNEQFLFYACNAKRKALGDDLLTKDEFDQILDENMQKMGIDPLFKTRSVNEGFSGGEKKRNEILQMAMLSPLIAVLDETDSGLDIDAMKMVAQSINQFRSESKSLLLITHYQRLLDYVMPDHIHVMVKGKIVHSGGSELALELEKFGYDQYLELAVRG